MVLDMGIYYGLLSLALGRYWFACELLRTSSYMRAIFDFPKLRFALVLNF